MNTLELDDRDCWLLMLALREKATSDDARAEENVGNPYGAVFQEQAVRMRMNINEPRTGHQAPPLDGIATLRDLFGGYNLHGPDPAVPHQDVRYLIQPACWVDNSGAFYQYGVSSHSSVVFLSRLANSITSAKSCDNPFPGSSLLRKCHAEPAAAAKHLGRGVDPSPDPSLRSG